MATPCIDEFHKLFYDHARTTWMDTRWLGVLVFKNPFDLLIYQEIIHEVRPSLIVECGSNSGGSALFFATLCDLVGNGKVVSIDIEAKLRPSHSRLSYLTGSSVDPQIIGRVRDMVRPGDSVLMSLDSDHTKAHVLAEMRAYGPLVTVGSYMVVEDGNVNGHPVHPGHGPGPAEAIAEFLASDNTFAQDRTREKFFMTFNPGGYLKKTR